MGDILQAKVDKLLSDIEGVKTYVDDFLVLSQESFYRLKFNAPKSSFGLKEITYLGYVITREGVKPDPEKVQGIMDLGRPYTTTEVRALIGIVQYYMDMWTSQSHILDPLIEADRGPKGRKILCNDTLKYFFKELKHMVFSETF